MKPLEVGDLRLYILSDGRMHGDGGGLFGVVPRVLWQRVAPPDELNRIAMAVNCLLIVTPRMKILVDTGLGDKLSTKQRAILSLERDGGLVAELHRLGVTPDDISIVVNTHLHGDHAGGNTLYRDGRLVLTFPKAEYWVQREEWQAATHPNERTQATYLAENLAPLEDSGVLRLIEGNTTVVPGVKCVLTPGHTPFHQSVLVSAGGTSALYLADVAPLAVHLKRVAWVPAFDLAPLTSMETKKAIIARALELDQILIFDHDPRIAAGKLRRIGQEHQVEPLPL